MWSPTTGLTPDSDPKKAQIKVSPTETTVYTRTATRNTPSGVVKETWKVRVVVMNLKNIITLFKDRGYIIVPIRVDGAIALQVPEVEVRGTSTVIDYAKIKFSKDGIVVGNLKTEIEKGFTTLSSNYNMNVKAFITKNENFCDGIFNKVIKEFDDYPLDASWHYHIIDTPNESDYLAVKIKKKSKFLILPQGQTQNGVGNTSNTSSEFTVWQRSFAPWRRFGHFPIPPIVEVLTVFKNSFWGDHRGFSTRKSVRTFQEREDNLGVTARLHQFLTFKLDKGLISQEGFCTTTRGYKNFIRTGPGFDELGNFNPLTPYKESSEPETPNYIGKVFKNDKTQNYLFMQIEGSDPLVVGAPDIDCLLILYIDKIAVNSKKYLHVRGNISYKAFPAYESFIKDAAGNAVFLHTYTAPKESALANELLPNCFDYIRGIDVKIRMNENDEFINDDMIVGFDSNNSSQRLMCASGGNDGFLLLKDPINQIPLFAKSNIFTYQTLKINEWNKQNTEKAPSQDCISSPPCEGVYPGDN